MLTKLYVLSGTPKYINTWKVTWKIYSVWIEKIKFKSERYNPC